MNITRENADNVNAVIKIVIEKPDYEKTVEEKLKEYRQNSSIPGFRPGKAPAGLIKRKFGKAVLIEEVNKLLSQNLTKYLMEEKLQVLGEPLGNEEQQKSIDWDKDENFEFVFDIALAPEIDVPLSEEDKMDYFTIKVSDEMVDQQMDMITSQMGQNVDADEVTEKSLVRGDFIQLDAEGNELEEGIRPEGVLLSVDLIKDEEIKKQFLGKQKGEVLVFDPVTAYQDRHEIGHLLNISHEEADELDSVFKFTITEIQEFDKAELNEELYKKIFGEDTEVKTEEDLRNRLKDEIATSLAQSSDNKFAVDVRDTLVEKINPELPETFLKRWLRVANKDVTEEQIENDFDGFLKDLRWQLIKDFLIKENELKVEEEEALNFAKQIAHAQFSQYGIQNAPEDQLDSFAKMILEKPEEKERLHNKLLEDKVVNVVKEKVTLEKKEVSKEEFEEMAK
ncbi:MAG: trigger factor [Prolixibacteraceae bacterium]|nr:trigger factor [Prolixibacteraceae bacterium]